MNMNNQPPALIPSEFCHEIEKLSKAALMDLVWSFAGRCATSCDEPDRADPKINAPDPKYKTRSYYFAGAAVAGSWIQIAYVTYQSHMRLRKADALTYLEWLDAGNVGTHRDRERQIAKEAR